MKKTEYRPEVYEIRYQNEYIRLFAICAKIGYNEGEVESYLRERFNKVADQTEVEVREDYIAYQIFND